MMLAISVITLFAAVDGLRLGGAGKKQTKAQQKSFALMFTTPISFSQGTRLSMSTPAKPGDRVKLGQGSGAAGKGKGTAFNYDPVSFCNVCVVLISRSARDTNRFINTS